MILNDFKNVQKTSDIKFCHDLEYDQNIFLHPDNFAKIEIKINFISEKEWKRLLLNSDLEAKKNEDLFGIQFYKKTKRTKSELIINIPNKIKCKLLANIRPHGLLSDHRDGSNILPSLNVVLEEGHIFGITKFILFRPESRNWDNEIIVSSILKQSGFLSPRTTNVLLSYNNLETNFIFQEKIAKEFLEINNYKEGPLYEGDNKFLLYFRNYPKERYNLTRHKLINQQWSKKNFNNMIISQEGLAILNRYNENYIRNLQKIRMVPSDYFYLDNKFEKDFFSKFDVYDSLNFALKSEHGLSSDDRVYYYDAFYKKFSPIYWDGTPYLLKRNNSLNFNKKKQILIPSAKIGSLKAIDKLSKIDNKKLLKNLNLYDVSISEKKLDDILDFVRDNLIKIRSIENEFIADLEFEKINSINKEKLSFDTEKLKVAFYDDNFEKFLFCDYYNVSCQLNDLDEDKKARLLSQELDVNNKDIIFLGKNIKEEKWFDEYQYQKDAKNIKIISFDDLKFKIKGDVEYDINKDDKIIKFIKNKTFGNVTFFESNINNWKIEFYSQTEDPFPGVDNENITGCLNFYDSKINNLKLSSIGSNCEDSINFVRSNGIIDKIDIKNSMFDSVDADFSSIKINNIIINNSKNDCLDFSYGTYKIDLAYLNKCGDKGVSAGELSLLEIKNLEILNSKIGVASKDFARVKIYNSSINDTKFCYQAYNKKQEFSGGLIDIKSSNCQNSEIEISSDEVSKIIYN